MPVEQYSALVELMPQIEKMLEKKGEKVPRPNYDNTTVDPPAEDKKEQDHGESEGDAVTDNEKSNIKNGKRKKANIEATSDEDEDA